jgi:hypothetical protein
MRVREEAGAKRLGLYEYIPGKSSFICCRRKRLITQHTLTEGPPAIR